MASREGEIFERIEGLRAAPRALGERLISLDKQGRLQAHDVADQRVELAWALELPAAGRRIWTSADHIVVAAPFDDHRAWVVNEQGALVDSIELADNLFDVRAIGERIALKTNQGQDLLLRSADGLVEAIPHDFTPSLMRALPEGFATADHDVLRVFYDDPEGSPAEPPVESAEPGGPPLETPIVIDGVVGIIRSRSPFAMRLELLDGAAYRVEREAPWRPLIEREQAESVLEALLRREVDQVKLPSEDPKELVMLPPAEAVPLHLCSLLAPEELPVRQRHPMKRARETFFTELSLALGRSKRGLIRLVRRGHPLVPPKPIAGFEYEGFFKTGGKVIVCDPCYLGRKEELLTLPLGVKAGQWHIYLRFAPVGMATSQRSSR